MITSRNQETLNITASILTAKTNCDTRLNKIGALLKAASVTISNVAKEINEILPEVVAIKEETISEAENMKNESTDPAIDDLIDGIINDAEEIDLSCLSEYFFAGCTDLFTSDCDASYSCALCFGSDYAHTIECSSSYSNVAGDASCDKYTGFLCSSSYTGGAYSDDGMYCVSQYDGNPTTCKSNWREIEYDPDVFEIDSVPIICKGSYSDEDVTCKGSFLMAYDGVVCSDYSNNSTGESWKSDCEVYSPESGCIIKYNTTNGDSCESSYNFDDSGLVICQSNHSTASGGSCVRDYTSEGDEGMMCSAGYSFPDGSCVSAYYEAESGNVGCAVSFITNDTICDYLYSSKENWTKCKDNYSTDKGGCWNQYNSNDGLVYCNGGFTNNEANIDCASGFTRDRDGIDTCSGSYCPSYTPCSPCVSGFTCSQCYGGGYNPCPSCYGGGQQPTCPQCYNTDYSPCSQCYNTTYSPCSRCYNGGYNYGCSGGQGLVCGQTAPTCTQCVDSSNS